MTNNIHDLFPELIGRRIVVVRNGEHFMGGYDLNRDDNPEEQCVNGIEVVLDDGTVLVVAGPHDEGVCAEIKPLAELDKRRNRELGIK